MYVGFSDSQNEKVKRQLPTRKEILQMSKGKIGTQGKNDLLDSHVLVQQHRTWENPLED